MTDKHLSTQFDAELSGISTRVLEMGGLVESQVAQAVYALSNFSGEIATQVLKVEERVNAMEVEIDRDLSTIIARRQPTARDLRLLIAISKTIANLERVGDEAARIARTVQRLINTGVSSRLRLPVSDLAFESELATLQLRIHLALRLVGRGGDGHLEAGMPQVDADQLRDRGFVLDHQNSTHATPFQRTIVSTVDTGLCRTSVPLTT